MKGVIVMKKVVSMMLAIIMLFAMSSTAFAAEVEIETPASANLNEVHATFGDADFVLISTDMQTRSTSLPTSFWSLATENYSADLQVVGKSWLYTNKYFHPNGDGKIFVDYDVTADSQTTYLYIGLYDLTEDQLVVEHSAIEVRTTGKTGSMYFYNLTQSHTYAVCFKAHPSSLNGSAVIHH